MHYPHYIFRKLFAGVFLAFLFAVECAAQPTIDGHYAEAKNAIEYLYNWEFSKVKGIADKLNIDAAEHPIAPILYAMRLYWENYPFDYESEEYRQHMRWIQLAIERAEHRLDEDRENEEMVFFKMLAESTLMRNYDANGQSMKAVGQARKVYAAIKKGFEMKDSFVEFYFTSGIYNYYRVHYPETHPIYKPFAWFFREGDKAEGLQQLDQAAREAVFTKAESMEYLAHIYLHHEEQPEKSLVYISKLHQYFPDNLFYEVLLTETLMLMKRYQDAMPHIQQLLKQQHKKFYYLAGITFNGWLQEMYHNNLEKALENYEKAEQLAIIIGEPAKEFKVYIYEERQIV